jgi:creatinine amidohydrolase
VVGPPISIGASGEHESFPGTLSIGTLALETVVVELARSALPPPGSPRPRPFRGVLFVNGHGGNVEALGRGTALLVTEGRDVDVWHPRVPDGDSHAGRTETSMMLHLDPGVVRVDRLEPGSTARWREIGAEVVANGLAAVAPNGVLGDPTQATEAEGRAVFDSLVADLVAHAAIRHPDPGS